MDIIASPGLCFFKGERGGEIENFRFNYSSLRGFVGRVVPEYMLKEVPFFLVIGNASSIRERRKKVEKQVNEILYQPFLF